MIMGPVKDIQTFQFLYCFDSLLFLLLLHTAFTVFAVGIIVYVFLFAGPLLYLYVVVQVLDGFVGLGFLGASRALQGLTVWAFLAFRFEGVSALSVRVLSSVEP